MQGHKKLIPELKLNDNLRKLRGGVTPTPTPTPTDSNVHVYHIEANMVERYNYSDCTINDDGVLYNKILADYQQYGNEHLYILTVKFIDQDYWWTNNFFLTFVNDYNVINIYAFIEEDGEISNIDIYQNRIYIKYHENYSYEHTTVEITDQNELYIYEAEEQGLDPVEYLINNIVSYYGVNTCIMLHTPSIPFCTLNQTCHFIDGSKLVYQICGYFDGGLITLTLSNDNGIYDWSLV